MTEPQPLETHLILTDPRQMDSRSFAEELRFTADKLSRALTVGDKCTVSTGGFTVEVCRYLDGWVVAKQGCCLTLAPAPRQVLPLWAHQLRLVLGEAPRSEGHI
jgi:hypothetical protein